MRLLLILCMLLALIGCRAHKSPTPEVPRPATGYMHWMHKQSMLGQARELIANVSQSQRVWLQPGEPGRADVLLKAAPNWLELVGVPANPQMPAFRELSAQIANAKRMGIGGIYLGETGERPDIWTSKDGKTASQKSASFNFDARFGSDADFDKLARVAETDGLELGSDLLAGATGRGPDFFLQARNVPEHGGLYALLPVPEEAIALLPLTHEEWNNDQLSTQTVADLVKKGLLPDSIARDKLAWASKGGWAATGPVMGADGVSRRWLYRYSENPSQPVLSWQDPSGQARKVLDAAAIRHTGMLGQSLAGLHFEPLMALEPGNSATLSPGIDALNEMARQVHRYGGWAMQADPLPSSAIAEVLRGACDFCRDDTTPLLLAYGLLTGDVRPLAQLYQGWISAGLEVARLARGYNAAYGLRPNLLLDNPGSANIGAKLTELGSNFKFKALVNQIFPNPSEAQEEMLIRATLAWRLGLPGLAFVEFQPGSLSAPSDGWLEHLLIARHESALAQAKVIAVCRGRSSLGIVSLLPNGGYWLLASNLGKNRDILTAVLPGPARSATVVGNAQTLSSGLNGRTFQLALDPYEAKNVVFEKGWAKPRNLKPQAPKSAPEATQQLDEVDSQAPESESPGELEAKKAVGTESAASQAIDAQVTAPAPRSTDETRATSPEEIKPSGQEVKAKPATGGETP